MPAEVDSIKGEEIIIDGIINGFIRVYDSIIIINPDRTVNAHFSLFNKLNGKALGEYFRKGRGPDEYLAASVVNQPFVENGELKTLVHLPMEDLLVQWNITQSIDSATTIIDKTWNFKKDPEMAYPYNLVYKVSDNTVIARRQPANISDDALDYSLPLYDKINLDDNYIIDKYEFFKKAFINDVDLISTPGASFYSQDRIHPDRSKIVMALELLGQFAIMDLQSHNISWYRIKETPDISYLKENPENYRYFFRTVTVDDDYIYALWVDKPYETSSSYTTSKSNSVLVFDWDGNPIKLLRLSEMVDNIWLDPAKKILYGKDNGEERLWSYSVNN